MSIGRLGRIGRLGNLSGGSASPWSRYWYGIEINEANSSPDVARIAGVGQMSLHASLPVHVKIRPCLLLDSGIVNYYLNPVDWTKQVSGAASNLTGADGQVMIEIPAYYRKVDNPSGGVYQKKISVYPIAGFELIPKYYVAAYEGSLNRVTLKLSSVKNLTTDYRGGNNNAAWDGANNSLLGKPATSFSLTAGRTYARNRGSNKWNVVPWRLDMLYYELFVIEHATLNSQKAVNATLTVDGYKQGGLGAGVTTVGDWSTFNNYNPVIPCGQSDALGSATGEVAYQIPGFSLVKIPRYRGVENIFGHIWKWNDGGSILHGAAGGVSKFYTCDVPANFADGTAVNYDYRGDVPVTAGYVKKMLHDAKGIMIPKEVGGDSVTYFSDYFYTPGLVNYWVALLRGGTANAGASAGFACLSTDYAASSADTRIGARLCYIP